MGASSDKRRERLAAALRENLKRRKARVRALKVVVGPGQTGDMSNEIAAREMRPNAAKKPD